MYFFDFSWPINCPVLLIWRGLPDDGMWSDENNSSYSLLTVLIITTLADRARFIVGPTDAVLTV